MKGPHGFHPEIELNQTGQASLRPLGGVSVNSLRLDTSFSSYKSNKNLSLVKGKENLNVALGTH